MTLERDFLLPIAPVAEVLFRADGELVEFKATLDLLQFTKLTGVCNACNDVIGLGGFSNALAFWTLSPPDREEMSTNGTPPGDAFVMVVADNAGDEDDRAGDATIGPLFVAGETIGKTMFVTKMTGCVEVFDVEEIFMGKAAETLFGGIHGVLLGSDSFLALTI